MVRITAGLVALALLSAAPVRAAEPSLLAGAETAAVGSSLAGDTDWSLKPMHLGSTESASRGALLPAMYASLAALNLYDVYSTRRGIAQGASETNGVVGTVAHTPAAFYALKATSTGVSIFVAERLWRHHRRAEAIAVMLVSNGVMAAVAARNASVLHQIR